MSYTQEWYLAHPISNEKRKIALRKRYQRVCELIVRSKAKPCMDCHIQYNPWVMDFDHRDPKDKIMAVSALKRTGSYNKVQQEIEKCDLVCANCHRERTHRRMQ